jgi:hypothetical protein
MGYSIIDLRPFTRNMRIGWQTFQTIFINFTNIFASFSIEHDFSTGRHLGGQFATADGRYDFDGSKYSLARGYGPLPETISPASTGMLRLDFTQVLSTDTYSIKLTTESAGYEPVTANYLIGSVSETGFDICIFKGGADPAPISVGFSVQITVA